jgi:hypothetical protein
MSQTYTVYINNLGYLKTPFMPEAENALEISEEEYKKTRSFKSETAWRWNYETKTFELVPSPSLMALRFAREVECFKFLNKSPMWFNRLTESQQAELTEWYQAWLDVTETQVIPTKPEWLK